MTSTHQSLSPGQIRLTWQEPAGLQYQPGTGYVKIECSRESTFQSLVDCVPNIVPVEDREVVLTLPDITQPYYARAYIVRNYNGQELIQNPDDRYYHIDIPAVSCSGKY